MKLSKLENQIEAIYRSHPEALELKNKKRLVRAIWKTFDGVSFPMSEEDHNRATDEESIVRARRKVRERLGLTDKITQQRQMQYFDYYSK